MNTNTATKLPSLVEVKHTNTYVTNAFNVYSKAIQEISHSAKLLTDKDLNLLMPTMCRQLLEISRILEIIEKKPDAIWAYELFLVKTELGKIKKSYTVIAKDQKYLLDRNNDQNWLQKQFKLLNLNSWESSIEHWNENNPIANEPYINKDPYLYNKLSEVSHMEFSALTAHYEVNYDNQNYTNEIKQYFDSLLKRCDNTLKSWHKKHPC